MADPAKRVEITRDEFDKLVFLYAVARKKKFDCKEYTEFGQLVIDKLVPDTAYSDANGGAASFEAVKAILEGRVASEYLYIALTSSRINATGRTIRQSLVKRLKDSVKDQRDIEVYLLDNVFQIKGTAPPAAFAREETGIDKAAVERMAEAQAAEDAKHPEEEMEAAVTQALLDMSQEDFINSFGNRYEELDHLRNDPNDRTPDEELKREEEALVGDMIDAYFEDGTWRTVPMPAPYIVQRLPGFFTKAPWQKVVEDDENDGEVTKSIRMFIDQRLKDAPLEGGKSRNRIIKEAMCDLFDISYDAIEVEGVTTSYVRGAAVAAYERSRASYQRARNALRGLGGFLPAFEARAPDRASRNVLRLLASVPAALVGAGAELTVDALATLAAPIYGIADALGGATTPAVKLPPLDLDLPQREVVLGKQLKELGAKIGTSDSIESAVIALSKKKLRVRPSVVKPDAMGLTAHGLSREPLGARWNQFFHYAGNTYCIFEVVGATGVFCVFKQPVKMIFLHETNRLERMFNPQLGLVLGTDFVHFGTEEDMEKKIKEDAGKPKPTPTPPPPTPAGGGGGGPGTRTDPGDRHMGYVMQRYKDDGITLDHADTKSLYELGVFKDPRDRRDLVIDKRRVYMNGSDVIAMYNENSVVFDHLRTSRYTGEFPRAVDETILSVTAKVRAACVAKTEDGTDLSAEAKIDKITRALQEAKLASFDAGKFKRDFKALGTMWEHETPELDFYKYGEDAIVEWVIHGVWVFPAYRKPAEE